MSSLAQEIEVTETGDAHCVLRVQWAGGTTYVNFVKRKNGEIRKSDTSPEPGCDSFLPRELFMRAYRTACAEIGKPKAAAEIPVEIIEATENYCKIRYGKIDLQFERIKGRVLGSKSNAGLARQAFMKVHGAAVAAMVQAGREKVTTSQNSWWRGR